MTRSALLLVRLHRQYWTWRKAYDPFGSAPQEHVLKPGVAMRRYDDQIGLEDARSFDHFPYQLCAFFLDLPLRG